MAGRWDSTTGGDGLRFFSPEQVDQILRIGSKRGRVGSHAAIERILRHEPGLERAELWRRIRQLKNPSPGPRYRRAVWSPEDDKILREGYERGWPGKQEAVRELLRRHPDWQSHVVRRRAAKLSLTGRSSKRGRQRDRRPWSPDDDGILLNLAGYKLAKAIGKTLDRTESAVRYRLAVLGKSSRVHKEGYARRALAEELHLGSRTIQRLIVEGLLEVRDPRITRHSLDDLCRSLQVLGARDDCPHEVEVHASEQQAAAGILQDGDPPEPGRTGAGMTSSRSSRAKLLWAEVAETLGISVETVKKHIAQGVLKLQDPRITEKSLRGFCRRYGSLINYEFLNQETRDWLHGSMDLVPSAGEPAAKQLEASRKHARVVRRCEGCGRTIRGNIYFRHIKRCGGNLRCG